MKKERLISLEILAVVIVLVFIALLAINPSMLGFTIYDSQPASEGKDTYIREGTEANYGTGTSIQIGKTAAGVNLRSLIEFNVSEVPSENTITSAIMQLYVSSINGNLTLKVYRLTSPWIETESTWNNMSSSNPWTTAGGDYLNEITALNISEIGWYNFTITSAVRNWINGSYENYGLILISENATNGNYTTIYSSDYSTAGLRPRITIDYTQNAAPSLTSISTNSNISSPLDIGSDVTFTIYWQDIEGNSAKAYICNSSNISISGCADTTFCSTTLSSTSPQSCSYTTQSSNNRTQQFYLALCDTNCSSSNSSYFYTNHLPNITLIQPNGGETVNQSQGNYRIKFNVSDTDSDALSGNLYYGSTRNSTTYLISSIDLASYCSDPDLDTSTRNNCSYSWNSTGIYGTYYLTLVLNDTFSYANKSSASSFNVYSIIDYTPPNILAQWIESYIYSGKSTSIFANITDDNMDTAWASFNYTSQNSTMSNTSFTFNTTFTAPAVGTYKFKVSARDKVANINSTEPWQEFTVTKPVATSQSETAPSTALPYSTIKITSQLNATDSLKDVYAYLNIPSGFTFLSGYSQNYYLGNFSNNETKTATWFLSAPISESTFPLNVTYTDFYSNVWNSSNMNIQTTTSLTGYSLELSGYPEVETTQSYYAESNFLQSSQYTSPDSMIVYIYDSLGSLIVGPVSMTEESTGKYNYSYTVGSSANEGQWETRVNATKSSTSYYKSQFWKVVGGPFDVRSITIDNSAIGSLQISVTTENTGGANKDLTLNWNLTRTDNNLPLDSGSDTFMVNAHSTKVWTIYPSTTYIGPVKISFLGHYSGTEKAGAYKLFSTTAAGNVSQPSSPSSGGGAGGSITTEPKKVSLEISDFTQNILLTKNIAKKVSVEIKNTGEQILEDVNLELVGLSPRYYTLVPEKLTLKPGQLGIFDITFFITDFTGELEFEYKASSGKANATQKAQISVLNIEEFFSKEIERLKDKLTELSKITTEDYKSELDKCSKIITQLSDDFKNEKYISANLEIREADDCLSSLTDKIKRQEKPMSLNIPWTTLIIIALVILVLGALVAIAVILYRKMSLVKFMTVNKPATAISPQKKDDLNERIKDIENKLKD